MNKLLEEVFATMQFKTWTGEVVKVHSETPKDQCEFLQRIIEENKFKNSLEVGFAFGLSTAAICESVAKFGGKHTVFDPEETSYWGGHGVDLVKQAGFSDVLNFRELPSAVGFAQLLKDGSGKYDFAYVDTGKLFDWIIVDFYFISQLLRVGGIVVFDDVNFPGIRKAMRFITQLPHFKVYDSHPKNECISKGKLGNLLTGWSRTSYLISEEFKKNDYELGINTRCVAFQKVSEDKRNWDWHQPF
jgi:predicted O-methyltransferase YrrM